MSNMCSDYLYQYGHSLFCSHSNPRLTPADEFQNHVDYLLRSKQREFTYRDFHGRKVLNPVDAKIFEVCFQRALKNSGFKIVDYNDKEDVVKYIVANDEEDENAEYLRLHVNKD